MGLGVYCLGPGLQGLFFYDETAPWPYSKRTVSGLSCVDSNRLNPNPKPFKLKNQTHNPTNLRTREPPRAPCLSDSSKDGGSFKASAERDNRRKEAQAGPWGFMSASKRAQGTMVLVTPSFLGFLQTVLRMSLE